jgi:heavy metal sensor kinase
MRLNRASISLRLTLWFFCIFLLGWVSFGAAMWFHLKLTLADERYLTLSRRIDRLQDLLHKTQNEDPAERFQEFKDFSHATGNGLAEIFRANGSRAFPSPSEAARSFAWPAVSTGDAQQFLQVKSAGQPYWVMARSFPLGTETLYLFAAAPASGNQLILDRFWEGLIVFAPILLLISSAGGYWLSRRALKPVDRITATARSISIRNLSERLPVTNSGDELERLTETCNAMLARLEAAVNRIKQFTGDASHELRGPLSFVRTVAEVALRYPGIDAESRQAFQDIVEEAAKAGILLEDMLTLARADAECSGTVLEPLNLVAAIQEAWDLARPIAAERNLTLTLSLGGARTVKVLGDFSSLRRLIWILLDNALKYTHAHGKIDVSLTASAQHTTVLVRDTGSGIPASDIPRIFDRFYRADPSRSQIEGSGLGLAIAKWIADLHHAEISVSSELDKGTTVQLLLPLCALPPPAL